VRHYDIQAYQAIKDVSASYDALVEPLQTIEHFLNRLEVYTEVPTTAAMREVVVEIMVELLSTIALVTKEIKLKRPCELILVTTVHRLTERGTVKFVKKLFGDNDVEAVLQRLDRLTQEEARITASQTFAVVHSLVQNVRVVMDSEATLSGLIHMCCLTFCSIDGKTSVDAIWGALGMFIWRV
jgi:hypothetical protein